jgi:nucleoside-diphosphate-sugar epimerase
MWTKVGDQEGIDGYGIVEGFGMTAPQTVLVTGASSFLGAHVCEYLANAHRVIGVWNSTPIHLIGVEPLKIDLFHETIPAHILRKVDVVVHLAGKIQPAGRHSAFQVNRQMMRRVIEMGKPLIYGSSTAVHWEQAVPYVQSRREDEQELMESGLPYAILRPCAPYGPRLQTHTPKHQESFQTLINTIRSAPVVPIIGNGQYLRQPLHVHDFAALSQHFIESGFQREVWDVAGSTVHSFNEVIEILQGAVGTNKRCVYIPKRMATWAARFVPNLEPSLISVIDNSESFDVTELNHLVPMRSFQTGVTDLL